MTELDKPYNPQEAEKKIYQLWEESGYFNPNNLATRDKRQETYTVMMAPPNITGSLHMGHALENTMSDILIRWKRMQGFQTLWLPGIDHAGIATQNIVEKELRKEGLSRHDLGREKFVEKVWQWKEKYGHIILEQLRQLGISADWSRARFTLDKEYAAAVSEAFNHYQKKGWIYRALRTINWCVHCQTSISDLEVEYKEEEAKLYYIQYGPFVLATVRPETKFGDTALAVHPSDERYQKYIDQEIEIESLDTTGSLDKPAKTKVKVKIVADEAVDPKFGTGVIKVTPAHDITDYEIAQRHSLPLKQVIDDKGRMNDNAGKYAGLKVKEAREIIVDDLKKVGLLIKEEPYHHNLAVCARCGYAIEPLPSQQWFLKMNELAALAKKAIEADEVKIIPENFRNNALAWLANIRDWCISRQLWWGHPILDSEDVLDTWFSSALWPFATLGWPNRTTDLEKFYPTQFITSAREILNLWILRMIFSGKELVGGKPFSTVLIHGTILNKEGRRMSKSLGTGIDPLVLIAKYGADATRFGIIWQAMGAQDIRWDEAAVVAGKKFANKLWNIAHYATLQKATEDNQAETAEDKDILAKLATTKKSVEQYLENYDFGQALRLIYDFVWHELADKYIEISKKRNSGSAQKTLNKVLGESLKLLHPFMPFITEEVYQKLNFPDKKSLLMIERW